MKEFSQNQNPENPAPFGAQQPRSGLPMYTAAVLYGGWFLFIAWETYKYAMSYR